jgi:hypothetical protein
LDPEPNDAMSEPEISDQQKLDQPAAPPANDDLTIAEHLRKWRQREGGGLVDFDDGEGSPIRIPADLAERFVKDHGALHPGDYRARFRRDWRDDFRALGDSDRDQR